MRRSAFAGLLFTVLVSTADAQVNIAVHQSTEDRSRYTFRSPDFTYSIPLSGNKVREIQRRLLRDRACRELPLRVVQDQWHYLLDYQHNAMGFRPHSIVLFDWNRAMVAETNTVRMSSAVKDICNDLRELLRARE